MAVSMRDLDSAFQGAGQKPGLEVWRIENSRPCPVPKASFGVFLTGDSYVILKTTALKCGGLHHVIHYWLGKDICKEEAGRAAIKAVELAAALGARAVQYREVQGHETELFLSYFRPCIIPQTVGAASGLKHAESEEYKTRLYVCKGKHVVRVKEVPFARSSLNHDDIFILDTKCKVFQFNGSNSSIQERAKALEVVKHIKDTYHDGKCEVAAIDDGKLMADLETGEFWGFFGGFAPLPRKTANDIDKSADASPKLFRIVEDHVESVLVDSLTRELHESNKCYILDCGLEVFIWMGRSSSIDERKSASRAAEELFSVHERPKCHIICIIEGFETVSFREKYDLWPQTTDMAIYEDGRGKVTALLRRQGVNVKGLLKTAPAREEPQPYIDCTGSLQVWRVNGQEKTLLSAHDQSKFYSGDCYIFQYAYLVEDKEEYLVGSWLGKQSIEDERISSISLARKMVESLKHPPAQARVYEGNEPVQFYAIFQRFIVFKGGISAGYKQYIAEKATKDDTYSEDCLALFRVQGSGPDDMQAIQVEPVASSLNSAYCYILHSGSSVFTWSGNLTTPDDQELVERLLDLIKPNVQSKPQKEGAESEQFWELLGGKSEYPNQKIKRETESEHHLFACSFSEGELKVTEIYNFTQDDLMTEEIYILDCYSEIFVWVGQQVNLKDRMLALTVGEKFVERDFLRENLSREVPLYIVMEGSEPPFFTRFFTWNSAKSMMHGNSFQRKFTILKNGGIPTHNKPKRRTPVSYGGRSGVPDKSQRSRSMSFSPERVRVRGRSPAFNALAATFENPNARNLSTPPPLVRKLYPKSVTPEAAKLASKSSAIAALGATYEKPPVRDALLPRSLKVSPEAPKVTPEANHKESPMSSRIEALTIQEDVKEGEAEDEDGLLIYPYNRLITTSMDPVADIDVTKRERYLSLGEFREKFGMEKDAFYKLPKWKQNKMKMALQLF